MHWTLAALIALCVSCLALNATQLAMRRTVRWAGLLICAAWAVQQAWWEKQGTDSLALFIACDLVVIGWFLARAFIWRSRFDIGERLIAATIPLTTALVVFAHINGGHTTETWWANWWLVAGQMMIGLPYLPVAAFWRRARETNRDFDPWDYLRKTMGAS